MKIRITVRTRTINKNKKAPLAKTTCQIKFKSWGTRPTPEKKIPDINPIMELKTENFLVLLESFEFLKNLKCSLQIERSRPSIYFFQYKVKNFLI